MIEAEGLIAGLCRRHGIDVTASQDARRRGRVLIARMLLQLRKIEPELCGAIATKALEELGEGPAEPRRAN